VVSLNSSAHCSAPIQTPIEIHAAEDMAKQRNVPKKGTPRRGGKSKGKTESNEECEADAYITDDGEMNLLDCIVIDVGNKMSLLPDLQCRLINFLLFALFHVFNFIED